MAPSLLQAVRAGHGGGQHGAEANGQAVQRHQSPGSAGLQVRLLGGWTRAPEGTGGGRGWLWRADLALQGWAHSPCSSGEEAEGVGEISKSPGRKPAPTSPRSPSHADNLECVLVLENVRLWDGSSREPLRLQQDTATAAPLLLAFSSVVFPALQLEVP